MDFLIRDPIQFDYARLRECVYDIIEDHKPSHPIVEIGARWSIELTVKNVEDPEHFGDLRYTELDPRFGHTYIEHVWNVMRSELDEGVCRLRIMVMEPMSALRWHRDYTNRYHLAIETNPESVIAMGGTERTDQICGISHIPADGWLYHFDASMYHLARNFGEHDRIHLVASGNVASEEAKRVVSEGKKYQSF